MEIFFVLSGLGIMIFLIFAGLGLGIYLSNK